MNYTRRQILRDTARVSAGLATSSSLPFLTGCEQKWGPKNPSCFKPGIRIFFIGAWLFCKDPMSDTSMLAVTRDMECMSHTFPYGVWPGREGISGSASLAENPVCSGITSADIKRYAYPVTVPKFVSSFQKVKDLFASSSNECSFLYFENALGDLQIDFTKPGIRVISLPIPARIITADFPPNSTLANRDDKHPIHCPNGRSTTSISNLAASAHIFDYEGASLLTFNGDPVISQGSSNHKSNFHFHTVPPGYAPHDHAALMFKNLTQSFLVWTQAHFHWWRRTLMRFLPLVITFPIVSNLKN